MTPPAYVVGVGASSTATATEVAALVGDALRAAGVAREAIRCVATIASRRDHPAVAALGWPVVAYTAAELAGTDAGPPGRPVVAEPAAMLAAGPGASLVVPKRRSAHATVAVARGR